MATVNFLYRSTKKNADLVLRLLYRHENKDIVFGSKTKINVSHEYWHKLHPQIRPKDIEISNKQVEINNELNRLTNHVLEAFKNINLEAINKDWLKNQIETYYNPPTPTEAIPISLVKYIDVYIDNKNKLVKPTSIMKFRTIQKKLQQMEAERGQPILITEINRDFLKEFEQYYNKNGYAINTVQKEFAFIKSFCRDARSNGIETTIQFDSLRLPKEKTQKIYLTFDELDKIENTELQSQALDNARKWLIISCYAGQRVSDFLNFRSDMIRIEDDVKLIEFTQQKTNKKMSLAVHPKILKILNSNNGEFPYKISDQRYNEYIKEVCKIAGIDNIITGSRINPNTRRKENGVFPKYELVSSHIGRRSYASNHYGTIPTPLLINVTGHSSETMFLNYIGKTQTQQAKELHKYYNYE